MRRFLVMLAISASALSSAAQARLPITEKIEWTWTDRPETPAADLPNVLLVGDSITKAYYPAVANDLKGVANVYLFATSACSGDPRVPEQLRGYFTMMGVHFAVVHFNNGMHGWQHGEKEYGDAFPRFLAAIKAQAPEARLIWANTTMLKVSPVLPQNDQTQASDERIAARNAIALEYIKPQNIDVDDLNSLGKAHPAFHSDNVHFNDQGIALQARQVAAQIELLLKH